MSNDNADHPPVGIVDDLLQGVLELHLAGVRHLSHLGLDAVGDDLLDGLG